ncbi:AAA family ATPase [Pseudomonas sp. N040]|uniref:AAA family ATPase n=1 Tax=Pseudomonas sp. N040 TaxID=2785325 RepID=UPI0018A27AAB|nr:AAA family ATPase [Pseudomonas sp. N040]MBF7728595.1 AAA family ATPase [Pseudomonas sp. N040]MBW7012235.1 ATP-dependent helicase [Pseudomonas sp. N040]
MAKIIPDIEKAKLSKQPPTEGELFLLNYFEASFDPDAEVYFQPCFNGERPDIVIIKKGVGIIIAEVKDWHLKNYNVNKNNQWHLAKNNALLRSPFAQAFAYKKNLFEVHTNGLLEKSMSSETFYGLIKVCVYFHNASKSDIAKLYEPALNELRYEIEENDKKFKDKKIEHDQYDKKRVYLSGKKKKLDRDTGQIAITQDSLKRIAFSGGRQNPLFEESVYTELMRLLQPPYHYANEGKPIVYTQTQSRLTESEANARAKICGIAGSGKTTVLAKRAVNAHRRHGDSVLILTFNLTLRMFVKDKINEVRDDFDWGSFHIINYHKFMTIALNEAGINIHAPQETEGDDGDAAMDYLEKNFYSNVDIFDEHDTIKYKTILIDEAQDYKPEWQTIIRKYFLDDDGEMVLFADEKQNIYDRSIDDEKKVRTISGFGRWQKLSKSFRYKKDSPVLQLANAFQEQFLSEKYNFEGDESYQHSASLFGVSIVSKWHIEKLNETAKLIIYIAQRERIHPNDIAVVHSKEDVLRKLDFILREGPDHQERTITTFASEEEAKIVRAKKLEPKATKELLRKIGIKRKQGFNLNSGVMKLTTMHSFKGFESPTIFLLIDEFDAPELIYTGLTRAKENIIILLNDGSRYESFFKRYLQEIIP